MNLIKSQYDEDIRTFKDTVKNICKNDIEKNGEMSPYAYILIKEGEGVGLVIMPLGHLMGNDNEKQELAKMIPKIFEKLEREGHIPICFAFATEVWVRKADKDYNWRDGNWKSLPKEEAVMILFETEYSSDNCIRPLIRKDGKVFLDEEREDFKSPTTEIEGRFANLFRKLNTQSKN